MKRKLKRHIGLIILIAIALVFPTSLNYQARLNMRIIVTGIAIDKTDDNYQVTAQVVKTSPGNESPGTNAEIAFITDQAKTLSEAVSRLAYKAGKVSAFSHTNFVIVGNSLLNEDVTLCLDYFIRDKIIKNSALIVFSEKSAEEEIKKTKETELSVGIGLQKVFLFKENEGDGLMTTIIDFLNQNKMYSGSAVASLMSLKTNDEYKQQKSQSGSSNSGQSLESQQSQTQQQGGSTSGSSSSQGGSGDASQSSQDSKQYFEPDAPLMCFVNGKYVGKIEDEFEVKGYMLANPETSKNEIYLENIDIGRLYNTKIEVAIKNKKCTQKVVYKNGKPTLEITVNIHKSELAEIMTSEVVAGLTKQEYDAIINATKEAVKGKITKCFETAKGFGCDVFNAYENAFKFKYNETVKYNTPQDFLKELNVEVKVNIYQLDY